VYQFFFNYVYQPSLFPDLPTKPPSLGKWSEGNTKFAFKEGSENEKKFFF
jgi:hypothetical protein